MAIRVTGACSDSWSIVFGDVSVSAHCTLDVLLFEAFRDSGYAVTRHLSHFAIANSVTELEMHVLFRCHAHCDVSH